MHFFVIRVFFKYKYSTILTLTIFRHCRHSLFFLCIRVVSTLQNRSVSGYSDRSLNFAHSIISSTSQSSSKMRMICQGFIESQPEISLFSIVSYSNTDPFQFSQIKIFVIIKIKSQLLYTIRQRISWTTMTLNCRDEYAMFKMSSILQCAKTRTNSYSDT